MSCVILAVKYIQARTSLVGQWIDIYFSQKRKPIVAVLIYFSNQVKEKEYHLSYARR